MYFLGDRSEELGVIEFYKDINMRDLISRENSAKDDDKVAVLDNILQKIEEKEDLNQSINDSKQLNDVFDKEVGLVKRLNTVQNFDSILPTDAIMCIDVSKDRHWMLICHKKGVDLFYVDDSGMINKELCIHLCSKFPIFRFF